MEDAAQVAEKWERISKEYDRVTRAFEEAGGYGYKSAINGVLKGLGLPEETFDRAVSTLSGGQRARLALARLLLQKPSLLLLDEPTNHLDIGAVGWLEEYLSAWQGAVVAVSHDRYFLDRLCTHTADMHRGVVDVYTGNYSSFVMQRQEKRRLQQKAFEHNQREISRQEKIIAQYYAWGRINGGKNFIKAKARENLLSKMERAERPESERSRISLSLSAAGRSGNDVLTVDGLDMAFGGNVLFTGPFLQAAARGTRGARRAERHRQDHAAQAYRGAAQPARRERAAGRGRHGGLLRPASGERSATHAHGDRRVREAYPNMADSVIRNTLAGFLFYGDDVFKPVSALSGGERGRLALLKLMLMKGTLLLLDEPTNHLDMDSREVLEDALIDFDGTVLFVSHDRYFINRVATRVIGMGEPVVQVEGGWDEYQQYLEAQREGTLPAAYENSGLTKTAQAKQKRAEKEEAQRREAAEKRLAGIEADIAQREQRLKEIEAALAGPSSLDENRLGSLSREYDALLSEIDALMKQWEEAQEKPQKKGTV
jgi:ATP-binding cassette subfamily F protein 3